MAILLGLLFLIEALVALLMVAVVMLQPPKDQAGGMGSAFGGGFGEEVFGGRTGNVLSRTTVVLGVILVLNSLLIAFLMRGRISGTSLANQPMAPAPEAPAAEVPAAPAPETPVPAPETPAPAAEAPAAAPEAAPAPAPEAAAPAPEAPVAAPEAPASAPEAPAAPAAEAPATPAQ